MMMDFYDQDRIMEIHIASERKIAAEEAAQKAANSEKIKTIERMLRDGTLSIDKIASFVGVSVEEVRKIESGMMQEA